MTLRLAIFGQAPFGREVTEKLAAAGHEIVGVYAPPDKGRPDPLAALAEERGWPLFRHPRFRKKGQAIESIVDEYRALGAELNVLPFTTVILPPEIIDAPKHGSICFHPSLLPAYRGGAALSWQIIEGVSETGVSVFRVDEGVDTGPIVIQRGGVRIEPADTMASLYFDKLYPMGVEAMLDAAAAVADGSARFVVQDESGASEHGLVNNEVARIDWSHDADAIERLVRACDPSPGAWAEADGETIRFFDARREEGRSDAAAGTLLAVEGGRFVIAGAAGTFSVGKARRGDNKKLAASECGVAAGVRFT
jgi:methionyl-tRNA formyltransferase